MKLSNNIEGVWLILKPIQADMKLEQSGNIVRGTYHNLEVKGTIEGTLTMDGEESTLILTGKWADQLGSGDFRVAIGKAIYPDRLSFYGNWKHSNSQSWDGLFEGESLSNLKKGNVS